MERLKSLRDDICALYGALAFDGAQNLPISDYYCDVKLVGSGMHTIGQLNGWKIFIKETVETIRYHSLDGRCCYGVVSDEEDDVARTDALYEIGVEVACLALETINPLTHSLENQSYGDGVLAALPPTTPLALANINAIKLPD